MSYFRKNLATTISFILIFSKTLLADTSLGNVVVTPDKNSAALDKTPSIVQVITKQDIEKQSATNVVDVLRNISGLDVVSLGSPGDDNDIHLRGADRDQVLLMIDSVPINAVRDHRLLFLGNIPVSQIERIEIVEGSQSVLYGSDAIGGVINIITKKGSQKFTPFVGFEGGNLALFKEQAGFSGSAGKSLWNFSGTRHDQRGRFERDRYGETSVGGNFSYQLTPQLKSEVGANYFHSNQELFYEFLATFDAPTSSYVIRMDPDTNRYLNRDFLQAHNTWSATPFTWWASSIQYGFLGDWERSGNSPTGDTVPAEFTAGTQDFHGHGYRHQIDFKNSFEWTPLTWGSPSTTIGFEFQDERLGFTDVSSSFPAAGQDGDRQNYAPYFLQNFSLLNNRLILSGGFRQDHNTTFGNEWSPRASILYKTKTTDTIFRATYSEGFHGPTILDYFSQVLLQLTGDPSFQPVRLQSELSRSYEAGVEQKFGSTKISGTFFYIDYDRLLDELQFIQNAYTTGFQVSAIAQPHSLIRLGSDYTFMESINEDSHTRMANRPQDRLHLLQSSILHAAH
ncbi:MAG: TonB-dependent receptor [Deltaproteobacteria bacterium]|nr:MAG: TonB-dependent receptor [Deltaproteobacteria bacterium]